VCFNNKNDLVDGFTKKYKCHRLVYYESFAYIGETIAREKEIKAWRREKKNALIETMNPQWRDLSEGWYEVRGFAREGSVIQKGNTRFLRIPGKPGCLEMTEGE